MYYIHIPSITLQHADHQGMPNYGQYEMVHLSMIIKEYIQLLLTMHYYGLLVTPNHIVGKYFKHFLIKHNGIMVLIQVATRT